MDQVYLFFIDDVIWSFRDLAKTRPASVFEHPFFAMLKQAHEAYGLKTQLNCFYQTDNYYGNDDFSLADMPDCWKEEFTACAHWLKMAFHARQEFPDYPYVNASYEQVYEDYQKVQQEITRFAGAASFTHAIIPHWLPVSYDGCRALYDCGVRMISVTDGPRTDYNGDPNSLPYGHAARLLQDRKPETMLYTRDSNNTALLRSICAYNHSDDPRFPQTLRTTESLPDTKTGLRFKKVCDDTCLNLFPMETLPDMLADRIGDPYVGIADHEQYFYPHYFAYQPDYAEKIFLTAKTLSEAGFRCIFIEDL